MTYFSLLIILIDIDDTSRFLKKPTGLRTNELWKTTSNVSAIGITDSKFNPLPNAGYVNPSNVNFSAFDLVKYKKIVFTESSVKELEKRYS